MKRSDVLFLDIYRSIGDSWLGGINNRSSVMRDILRYTTLTDSYKDYFETHIKTIINDYDLDKTLFDGRIYSKYSKISIDKLTNDYTWCDADYYKKHSVFNISPAIFYETYPWFGCNDFRGNVLIPQIRGKEINFDGIDSHSPEQKTKTMFLIQQIIKEDG